MKSKILGLLAVGLLTGPVTASAVVISISGQGAADGQWDITTLPGPGLANTLDDQIWWGNSGLAQIFAATVGGSLGMPNLGGARGPVFAATTTLGQWWNGTSVNGVSFPESYNGVFAVGVRVASVPEPGTLTLLGLGLAGLGFTRRRKLN